MRDTFNQSEISVGLTCKALCVRRYDGVYFLTAILFVCVLVAVVQTTDEAMSFPPETAAADTTPVNANRKAIQILTSSNDVASATAAPVTSVAMATAAEEFSGETRTTLIIVCVAVLSGVIAVGLIAKIIFCFVKKRENKKCDKCEQEVEGKDLKLDIANDTQKIY